MRVDGLSAFFLIVISGLSLAAAWYAVAYTRRMEGDLVGFYPPFLLFIAGMAGVVVVDDFFFFFVPWEFMALSSYVLVIFHKEKNQNLVAGFKYFFITHAGTLALFFGVALLVTGAGSSFQFEAMARSMPSLLASRPVFTHFALLLILLGFLVKSGCFPFGMWWLPDAHPAAPSPVSALLSGAMIKLGLYGILRVFFQILPSGSWTSAWGLVIGTFGVLSLFFGTMTALVQHDSKRLLAYSSIGQVGYMLLGFGIGMGLARTDPGLAAVGLIGGLFHLLNHACFKGLLFLNAGTFEFATGERDLNRLGGLDKLLPLTASCTIVASFSIAGLPPFNGFSSKWLLYHASVWGSHGGAVSFLFFGIVAIFISAVTLAIFLKFMGATIWGAPSPTVLATKPVREGPWLGLSQLFLALLCVGLGLFPYAGAQLCYRVAAVLTRPDVLGSFSSLFGSQALSLEVHDEGAVVGLWSPVIVGSIFVAAFVLAIGIRRLAASPQRAVATWSCGSEVTPEEIRFRADSYYTPFKKFVHLILPEWRLAWRPQPWPVVTRVLNPDGWCYNPLVKGMLGLFRWIARSRAGLPQVYPAWTLIGLTASFVLLFVLSR
jgi:hydrogenase-4 component B